MPLSLTELEEIRANAFADDIAIPRGAAYWTEVEALEFFDSGGTAVPKNPANVATGEPGAEPYQPLFWHSRAESSESLAASAITSVEAHKSEQVSRVRVFRDHLGAVGAPGELLAASGSWDCRVCVWRVGGTDGRALTSPSLLCELNPPDNRWVYDVALCGYLRGGASNRPALGLISTHTGGMVGEPENLIRLWSLRRDARAGADSGEGGEGSGEGGGNVAGRIAQKLNVEGSSNGPVPRGTFSAGGAHLRGVHGVDCTDTHICTISQDKIVAWEIDRPAGRGQEVVRVDSLLSSRSAGSQRVLCLSGGREVVPIGRYDDGLVPILSLHTGLATVETLALKGGDATALIEVGGAAATAGGVGAVDGRCFPIVASNANRAFLWDRRAGPQPRSRLALGSIAAFATLPGDAPGAGAPHALLAASGRQVYVFDVRRLPEDSPAVKRPPAALATLTAASTRRGAWTSLAALGGVVVAGDRDGGCTIWDVGTAGISGAPELS